MRLCVLMTERESVYLYVSVCVCACACVSVWCSDDREKEGSFHLGGVSIRRGGGGEEWRGRGRGGSSSHEGEEKA